MESIYEFIMNIVSNTSSLSLFLNCILIIIESIIPPLPLGLFITILFVNYGSFIGFIISWIFTIIGCTISFYLFQTLFKNIIDKYIRSHESANKFIKAIDNVSFGNLVLIMSIPFTPAFLVNIAAGISQIPIKKFILALIVGKISLVLFWGHVGTNLIEALKDPNKLIIVILLMVFANILSKIVNKKLKID